MPEAKFRVKILPSNDGYLTDMIEYAKDDLYLCLGKFTIIPFFLVIIIPHLSKIKSPIMGFIII